MEPLTYFIHRLCAQSHLTLCSPMDWSPTPLSMGFPRKEYWSGLPFPAPGDLPDPGIKLTSLESPALAGRFFTWEARSLTIPIG